MRAMRDLCSVDYYWYLHEYEVSQVPELLSRERLTIHGLLDHIDGEWDRRSLNAVWKELNTLIGLESILGTWFPPKDSILRA